MVSENIKALRKAKGLSQEELAARLNVVRQTVSKWEQGLSVPDADLSVQISAVLETCRTAEGYFGSKRAYGISFWRRSKANRIKGWLSMSS